MNENEVVADRASNQAEMEAERRIEERWEAAFDGMDEKTAREWAKLDVDDFGKIQDKELARFAAVTITSNMENPGYKVEFERGGQELLARVAERNAANDALVAAKEERKARAYDAMLASRQESAKNWSPEEASKQALIDVADYARALHDQQTNLNDVPGVELHYRLADMRMYSRANPAYLGALERAVPALAREISHTEQQTISGTFVGKITALNDTYVAQKVGRNPHDLMVHARHALSGDDVAVGHVVTISYEMGKGRLSNQDLAVEQRGVGR